MTLVTGAASGIGRASTILFAREGAKVVALDRAGSVADTAAQIAKDGGEAIALVADAAVESEISAAVDRAVQAYGALDALYANAGVSGGLKNFLELTPQDWIDVLSPSPTAPPGPRCTH